MPTTLWSPGEFINPGDLRAPRSSLPTEVQQIANGNFEAGNTGWTFENPAITITTSPNAFDGTFIMAWASSLYGTHYASNTELVEVVPGQVITAQMRYRRDTNNSGRQGTAIGIAWYESDGTTLIDTTFSSEYNTGATGVWYGASNAFTAPATAAFARLVIAGRNNNDGGTHGQYWDAISWDYIQPAAQAGLVYRAVQANAGFTAATEPEWPVTLGATVVDNEVTWEAVIASSVTWEATPILESGATEPDWPVEIGAQILDNNIAWQAISRMVTDEKCPHSKVVVIGASKIFAADEDIIPYSATTNPLDWSTKDDAGYLPFGLQVYGANPVAAMGLYRSNLVAFNSQGFQMWQIDQDPANMAFLDGVPAGSTYPRALFPFANDLAILNAVGVRNLSVAGASTNLQADGVGEPIDPLVKPKVKALEDPSDALGIFWPAQGQGWVVFGDEVFVLTINAAKKKSWSRYVFPQEITDATINGNDLIVRTDEHRIWRLSYDALKDDIYSVGDPPVLSGIVQFGENELTWTAVDPEGTGDIVSYSLERSIGAGAYSAVATILAADPLEFSEEIASPSTYHYRVRALNDVGSYTGYSNTVDLVPSDFGNNVLLLQYDTGVQVESTEVPHIEIFDGSGVSGISTARFKFGTASYHNQNEAVDNTNFVDPYDDVRLTRFAFAGMFTMEAWFNRDTDGGGELSTLFANNKTPSAGYFFLGPHWNSAGFDGEPANSLTFEYNAGGSVNLSDLIMGYDQWIHIAITRDENNVVRVFLNGVPSAIQPVIPGTFGGVAADSATHFTICEGVPFVSADFDGWFDQVRVTRNVCRYTTNFTPPAAPFPTE